MKWTQTWKHTISVLHWKYFIVIIILTFAFAIVNNLRQSPETKVDWIGGQPLLEETAGEPL